MSDTYGPAGDCLRGLEMIVLPDDIIPLDAIVLVRCLDGDGNRGWYTRTTKGLSACDSLGVLTTMHALELRRATSDYEPEEEDNG